MKYFDKLTDAVASAFAARAVDVDRLKYCVKADMDSEGCYYDVYVTYDEEKLYILSGYDRLVKNRKTFDSAFDFKDYAEYDNADIERLYVDRYQYTCRLIAKMTDGRELPLGRFSSGFSEKFEQFCRRFECLKKNEEPDDSALDDKHLYCPKCQRKYPDPNRRFCPYCTKRSWIFKRLLGMFGDYKWQMGIILVMIGLSVALGLISPYFGTKLLYDDVLNANGSLYGQILTVIIAMGAFSLVSTIFSIVYGIVISCITPKVVHKLRTDIFTAMQRLSLSFFTNKQTGSLMGRVDRDSSDVYFFFTDIVPQCIANVIKILGLVVLMLMINPLVSVCMLAVAVFVLMCEIIWMRGQRRNWRNRDIARRGVNSVLTDALNGHRVVKAFAREQQEIGRFGKRNDQLYIADYNRGRRSAQFFPVQQGVYAICNGLIYCLGVYLVLNGQLEFGGLTLLISYFGVVWDPMFFFMYMGNDWSRCTDAAGRMFEILDSEPTVKEPEHPAEIAEGGLKGDIEFKGVTFEYEAGRPVLKNMSFKTEAGKFTGIVGKTGAGKSTMINLISRMYDVTSGEITIDGIPIKKIPFKALRESIGVVSQETYLFMGTIADNIRYARPDASMEEVIQAAKNANAHDFIMQLPDGYDTITGSGGISLSGGEKQRISIARALIQKPNILILDEATAAMDTATERKIQNAIDNLKQGRTIIAIAHRLSTLRDADMLNVIENGELKESGTHDELIRANGTYFELYKLQSMSLKSIGIGE
ncbi:MAG: ATP-binding cassette domain-containing protein [Eubacterium sp.]|nr:ATP-binding cassette domain-containing protein [Eubacterium sp.]